MVLHYMPLDTSHWNARSSAVHGNAEQILEVNMRSQARSYIRSAEAYYSKYRRLPSSSKDLGGYVTVQGCEKPSTQWCMKNLTKNYSSLALKSWIDAAGLYRFTMNPGINTINIVAAPLGHNRLKRGVTACFNSSTGIKKVEIVDTNKRGTILAAADCTTK